MPFPGGTVLFKPILLPVPVALGGVPGAAGAGALDLSLAPIAPLATGLTLYMQAVVADPGVPDGLALTNGWQVTFGL